MQPSDAAMPSGRLPTGIFGFDEITDGGLPRGGLTVVMGGAGAGKTIFGLQVLASHAPALPVAGIVVAFEESAEKIIDHTAGFPWGGSALSGGGVEVIDARLSQSIEHGGEFDLVALLAIVGAKASLLHADRVVFDGLDVLLGYLADAGLVRREMFRLRDWAHASCLSVIVTAKADAAQAGNAPGFDFLQYIADCVVMLDHRVSHGVGLRFVRVTKYRGSSHSTNELPFVISSDGIEVAASSSFEVIHGASSERVSSGVERLDAMLMGGYHRGSSVLITGAPGTAKTSLAATFVVAAAERGERSLYLSFDESPAQLMRNAASIALGLQKHVDSGHVILHALRARGASPEAHIARIRALLREHQAYNLVVDPLSALQLRGSDADAEGAALELLDFAKSAGVTVLSTSLLGNTLPLNEQTPLNISTIADTWMHVSYVSQGGERNRALTIVKARGTGHSNQVRELILSDAGVTLADVYSAGGEVLMGTLRWEKENDERRQRAAAEGVAKLREQRATLALAELNAKLDTLARARAIQELELEELMADAAAKTALHDRDAQQLLQRRRADSGTPATDTQDEERV